MTIFERGLNSHVSPIELLVVGSVPCCIFHWIVIPYPDSESIIDEQLKERKGGFKEGDNVGFFVDSNKEVGNGWGQVHAHRNLCVGEQSDFQSACNYCLTIFSALISAVALMCGKFSLVVSFSGYSDRRWMQCCVSMFIYIETASYVERHAFAGSVSIDSRSCLSSVEFLK